MTNAVNPRDYAITGSKTHRDVLEDRVELTSPGSLPNHMTTASIRAGGTARSRDESMANFMLAIGFMEQRGRGWPIMRRAMRQFNETEPGIEVDADTRIVRVRFDLRSPTRP